MTNQPKRTGLRAVTYLLILAVMVYVVVYMPTPYIVYRPGSAEEIKPMIEIKESDPEEEGTFMLTTVSGSYANIALLAISVFNPHASVDRKEARLGTRSEDEYAAEQVYYMSNSQSTAMEAAYTKAGVPYSIVTEYMYVFSVSKDSERGNYFKSGDKIWEVDGERASDHDTLTALLKEKEVGESVTVRLQRKGEMIDEKVPLVAIKDEKTSITRPGLGVTIASVQKVAANNPKHQVNFIDTRIGGPSAGLMFTLEIYNQLTPGDLSKGYRVAGTGTMKDKSGAVGAIGGVQFKIVAAHRKKADIFFVPQDNYKDAKAKADSIGTDMVIVPVSTLDDAISYLEQLEPKAE